MCVSVCGDGVEKVGVQRKREKGQKERTRKKGEKKASAALVPSCV